MIGIVVAVLAIALSLHFMLVRRGRLAHLPGPTPVPIFGTILHLNLKQPHISMHEMAKKYGPVFRLNFQGKPCVILCDFASIYEALVTKAAHFAGRPITYIQEVITEGQSGIVRTDLGPEVQGRRRLVQMYLKQECQKIKEEVIMESTADMIKYLSQCNREPVDIHDILMRCTFDVTAIMLTGEKFSDETIRETHIRFMHGSVALRKSLSAEIVNRFPFMRHFGNQAYKSAQKVVELKCTLIDKWLESKPNNGFINFLQELSVKDKIKYQVTETRHQRHSIYDMYVTSVLTSSSTLTVLMNVLCHRPDIQEKLRREIEDVIGESRPPCRADYEHMPYHVATLHEIGRYASIAALGIPHKTIRDTTLESAGQTIYIPAGTEVLTNLWSMHHNEELFLEPFDFHPSRFLDSAGKLVQPDHPNRKHVMAFGAGLRVCPGQQFAMNQMFLILSRLMQVFYILPESTLDKQPSCDSRDFEHGRPKKFKVRCVTTL